MKTLILLAIVFASVLSQAMTLDGVAAKVNDSVITVGDVMEEMKRNRHELHPGTDLKAAYSNTVENLVNKRLILAEAARKKLDMQEWMVDNRIREIVKESFGGDMNKLTAMLDQAKVVMSDWRSEIRDEMIVSAMRYQLVDKNIVATPGDLRREYTEHPERYQRKAATTVSVILLRPATDNKTPSVSTRGEELLGRIEKGEDFASLARQFSADSHAKNGGVWRDVNPAEAFRAEIAEAIAKLKVGEVSPLVNLDGWGFIVRKDAENAEQKLSFEKAYEQIERNVKLRLGKAEHQAWMQRLRADAFIKIYPAPDDVK